MISNLFQIRSRTHAKSEGTPETMYDQQYTDSSKVNLDLLAQSVPTSDIQSLTDDTNSTDISGSVNKLNNR